jgi:hypothetical protein
VQQGYDYIIVGAGSACVLRQSADRGRPGTLLLIEQAGAAVAHHIPIGMGKITWPARLGFSHRAEPVSTPRIERCAAGAGRLVLDPVMAYTRPSR